MEFLFLPVTCFSARMQLTPLECIKAEIFALLTPVIKVLLVVMKLGFLSGLWRMNTFRSDECVESAPSDFHFSLLGPQGIPITKEGNGKPRVVLYKTEPVSMPGFTAGVYTKGWCLVEGTDENSVVKKM